MEHDPTADADTSTAGPLVTVDALQRELFSASPPTVLDVRWTLQGTDRAAFRAGHLPGAVFVDLDTELTGPPGPGGRHPLPQPAVLQQLFVRAGIHPDTAVVVTGQADTAVAARAWWLLRWAGHRSVRVLDGGVGAWRRAGLPLEVGDGADPGGGTAQVRVGHMPTVDTDGAAIHGADPHRVLLDAREPARHRGEIEPVDPIPGRIPGAVNLPVAAVHTVDGHLAPRARLHTVLAAAGAGPHVPTVAACGSGVTACALVLAGDIVGRRFALYPGSYSQWCAQHRPVEVG